MKTLSEHEKIAWRAMCEAAGVDSGLAATARECDECGVKDETVKELPSGWLICADCYGAGEDVVNKPSPKHSHYYKSVKHLEVMDWYRACDLFGQGDAALQHAGKKIMFAGLRGAKDARKDIQEAIDTLQRKMAMMDEDDRA